MINLEKLRAEQDKLAKKVITHDTFENEDIKTIGGIDQTYTSNNRIISAAVVIDRKSLKEIEAKYSVMEVNFPYIPGFLSYRELPAMVEAYRMLEQRPDMIIIDGNGILHPRRLGLASHLGILLDAVTIGVAKNLLSGEVDGERVIIDKEVRGYRLVTKEHANPIFISPGHKIGLASAIDLAKKLIIPPHKLPEPVHLAHKLANRVKKELKDAEDAVKGVAPSPA
ncbi:endonuclease V [Candidatus Woesearchaeota archaeon]|nr:endonuclease V [Candidatus Woesearchaeota archaeon]